MKNKKSSFKKLITLLIMVVMLFATMTFSGCSIEECVLGPNTGVEKEVEDGSEKDKDKDCDPEKGTSSEMMEKEILDAFDLTDPKDIWDGDVDNLIDGNYLYNSIFIIFRRIRDGKFYPLLKLYHFNLPTAIGFEYFSSEPPPTWSGDPALGEFFRQSGFILFSEGTPQLLLQAIRHLESLSFIQSVHPLPMVSLHTL